MKYFLIVFYSSPVQIILHLWFASLYWNSVTKQQCDCVYMVRIDTGSYEAKNGVYNLNFLWRNYSGEYADYCDHQVQQNTWEPHVFFPILFVLCWFLVFNIHTPRLIVDALSAKKIISYNECMTRVFALHLFGCMEIFVLILVAVDHHVAIYKALHYQTIIRQHKTGMC